LNYGSCLFSTAVIEIFAFHGCGVKSSCPASGANPVKHGFVCFLFCKIRTPRLSRTIDDDVETAAAFWAKPFGVNGLYSLVLILLNN
jgi:hypothetical protein